MAYSTGSGDYNALMAAVLAHAIADGWTSTGGNWPISKGVVRGVDWSTRTLSVTDYLSGAGIGFTERIIDLAIGTSPANATANAVAGATSVMIRNMNFSITEWFIFSDPSEGDYIHVVTRFSNGYDADCYNHFSFGELNKGGMGHSGIAYATSSARRAYMGLIGTSGTNTVQSYDWNCGINNNFILPFSGRIGYPSNYDRWSTNTNTLVYIIDPTTPPVPAAGGWVQPNIVGNPISVLDTTAPDDATLPSYPGMLTDTTGYAFSMNFITGVCQAQPYSGGVSMGAFPLILLNSTGTSAQGMFVGVFPGVRLCTIDTYAPKDEISYGAETWKLFPLLKKTSWANMLQNGIVSSGETGLAYRKVV